MVEEEFRIINNAFAYSLRDKFIMVIVKADYGVRCNDQNNAFVVKFPQNKDDFLDMFKLMQHRFDLGKHIIINDKNSINIDRNDITINLLCCIFNDTYTKLVDFTFDEFVSFYQFHTIHGTLKNENVYTIQFKIHTKYLKLPLPNNNRNAMLNELNNSIDDTSNSPSRILHTSEQERDDEESDESIDYWYPP